MGITKTWNNCTKYTNNKIDEIDKIVLPVMYVKSIPGRPQDFQARYPKYTSCIIFLSSSSYSKYCLVQSEYCSAEYLMSLLGDDDGVGGEVLCSYLLGTGEQNGPDIKIHDCGSWCVQ